MSLESLFQGANALALVGWVVLLFAYRKQRLERILLLPLVLLLCGAYTLLFIPSFAQTSGGFGSLDEVARLFADDRLLLAGWIHYLAFDLLIGLREIQDARGEGIKLLWLLPVLALTFFCGPVGFLAFQGLRGLRRIKP